MIELTPTVTDWSYNKALESYACVANKPYSLFFDSSMKSHPLSKWSFIAFDPIETIESKNDVVKHNNIAIKESDVFSFIKKRLDNYNIKKSKNINIPFYGGAAGYFGYDLGRQIEKLPNDTIDDLNLPDCMVGIYTKVIAFDHKNKKSFFISLSQDKKIISPPDTGNIDIDAYSPPQNTTWKEQVSANEYKRKIAKTIDYINSGEIYQANISRRFDSILPDNFNAFNHYILLRNINPAPFGAFMNFDNFQLSCSSPERFLTLKNNNVETRPIKGTLSTDKNPNELKNSKKDNAENLMIVDLLRNDISKTCKPHSVKVSSLCNIETFKGIHHLVSTITGELKENENALSLLKSCFPGGSITGAPKIRSMGIIEELEETRRGPYCGAMGYIGFNGDMDTNIIIRTLIYKNGKAYLQTGSGIVSDSNLSQELQEGLDKAEKIFESFRPAKKESAA